VLRFPFCASYGFLRGARAEARHLARFYDAPTLAELIPVAPPPPHPQPGHHASPGQLAASPGGGSGSGNGGSNAGRSVAGIDRLLLASALGTAWRALLGATRFVGSPWRALPFLLHALTGCAVGATLLGTPRIAGCVSTCACLRALMGAC
jgi:hypothetical protein